MFSPRTPRSTVYYNYGNAALHWKPIPRYKVYKSNNDPSMGLYLDKLNLVNELRDLNDEVNELSNRVRLSEAKYERKMEKTTKIETDDAKETCKEKEEIEKFSNNTRKVTKLQSEVEELDIQINFLKTLFSEDKLNKMREEVSDQRYRHENIVNELQRMTEVTEMALLECDDQKVAEKIQEKIDLQTLKKQHKHELEELRKEGLKLMTEAKEMQKIDPIDQNTKKLQILRQTLKRMKGRRAIHERNAAEAKKRSEQHQIIEDSVKEANKLERRRTVREKEKASQLKKSIDTNPHTLMPTESLKPSRKGCRKEKIAEDDLFMITQQKENILPEAECENPQ